MLIFVIVILVENRNLFSFLDLRRFPEMNLKNIFGDGNLVGKFLAEFPSPKSENSGKILAGKS